jgi:hypothetical protein
MASFHSKGLRDREGIPCSIMSLTYNHINTKITLIAAVMRVTKDTITLTMDIIMVITTMPTAEINRDSLLRYV